MQESYRIMEGESFDNRSSLIKLNYNDVLDWIKKKEIELAPYQEDMLKDMCEGREFISFRGAGRSKVASLVGEYVANLFSENNYNKNPVNRYPYTLAVPLKEAYEHIKTLTSELQFRMEYSLDYDYEKQQ